MTAMSSAASDLSTFTIMCNGSPLPARYRLEYLDIRSVTNRIGSAELAFIDGDPAAQSFALSAADDMVPGAEIEILLGYHRQESSLFKGILVRQQIKATRGGQSRLLISCRDRCFLMAQAPRSAHFRELSDADLISQLCAAHGIDAEVSSTAVTHLDIVQRRESDWDFLLRRAERNGLAVYTRDGRLLAQPVSPRPTTVTLSYGRNVIDLDLQLDARLQFSEVEAQAWSAAEQASSVQTGTGDTPGPGTPSSAELAATSADQTLSLRVDGQVDPQALQTWADAVRQRQQLAKVLGTVTVQGTAELRCGDWVRLAGLGARFDGEAYVGGVLHALSRGKWLTTVQIGQDPQWHMARFGQEDGLAWQPATSGLHLGKVVQLAGDPAGEERILVKLPTLGEAHEGVWARLASLDAGDGRGWVVRPELDDEVLLGFLDGDPEQPVVLGQLHSSARPAPLPAEDDNHHKGWTTRSGIRLLVDDDKKILRLETPAGNRLLFDEDASSITLEDQHGSKLHLDSEGIMLSTDGKLTLESGKDLSLKGMNVSIEAQMNAELKGGAGSTLESSGSTVVKGSVVQIN